MRLRLLALALVGLVAACGKKDPEPAPAPDPGPPPPAAPTPAPPPPPPPAAADPSEAEIRADLLRTISEPIYFEYNEDAIRADAQPILARKAAILLANPALRIRIAGHADERGTDEYNLVLGTRRATSAKRFLESRGIDGSRIEVVSFGEERPVDTSGTEAGYAKNRRDEFEAIAGTDRLVRPQ